MTEIVLKSCHLKERLQQRIRAGGPITFCDWMEAALYEETDGYYRRKDLKRWGRAGDYRTSPERSHLFAATFARYFAQLYDVLGRPATWTILEAGAGNGSFAYGVLKTLQRDFPEVFAATRYLIDEPGDYLDGPARELLEPFADRVNFHALGETKIDSGVVFSNELLDALPVHRVIQQDSELREFFVDVGPTGEFVWKIQPPSTARLTAYFDRARVQLTEGQIAEVNLAAEDWLRLAAGSIIDGYLVTVDYGYEADELYSAELRPEGTLRGFKHHRIIDDLLANPGEQDLTSSVNWTSVKLTGNDVGLQTIAFERQDKFLLGSGLLTNCNWKLSWPQMKLSG